MDKAWLERRGASIVVRTNYAGIVAVFAAERGNIIRGGDPNKLTDPYPNAIAYLRAMAARGVQTTESIA